jgi:hypothetical protein
LVINIIIFIVSHFSESHEALEELEDIVCNVFGLIPNENGRQEGTEGENDGILVSRCLVIKAALSVHKKNANFPSIHFPHERLSPNVDSFRDSFHSSLPPELHLQIVRVEPIWITGWALQVLKKEVEHEGLPFPGISIDGIEDEGTLADFIENGEEGWDVDVDLVGKDSEYGMDLGHCDKFV